MKKFFLIFFSIFLLPILVHAGDLRYKLTRDPFEPPGVTKNKQKTEDRKTDRERKAPVFTRESIMSEAKTLLLNATLTGKKPMANISGMMMKPGDRIRGFTLLSVESDEVVLKKKGIKVALSLRQSKTE